MFAVLSTEHVLYRVSPKNVVLNSSLNFDSKTFMFILVSMFIYSAFVQLYLFSIC